jgi:hypothetical protein
VQFPLAISVSGIFAPSSRDALYTPPDYIYEKLDKDGSKIPWQFQFAGFFLFSTGVLYIHPWTIFIRKIEMRHLKPKQLLKFDTAFKKKQK